MQKPLLVSISYWIVCRLLFTKALSCDKKVQDKKILSYNQLYIINYFQVFKQVLLLSCYSNVMCYFSVKIQAYLFLTYQSSLLIILILNAFYVIKENYQFQLQQIGLSFIKIQKILIIEFFLILKFLISKFQAIYATCLLFSF